MLLGGNETTRKIDSFAINELKIPGIVLMENAAISFVKHIDENEDNFLIICGKGNNGGDGYAIARQLFSKGKNVKIFCISNENMSNDCTINYKICKNMGIKIFYEIEELDKLLLNCNVVIEGIFGTGLNSEIKGIYCEIIEKINAVSNNKKIYSIDIPSGINGDTGEIMGISIKADITISFVTYKKGFLNSKIKNYLGKVIIENIGLNESNINHLINEYYLTPEMIKSFHIERNEDSHKGDFGKVLIFAGSNGFYGAGNIVAKSCVRSGVGLTTVITDKNNFSLNVFVPEAMSFPINFNNINENFEKLQNEILNSDVIAIGPGIGKSQEALEILEKLINIEKNNKGNMIKLVLDADALNLLAENRELFGNIKNRAILTPHLVEFSRLTGFLPDEINKNKLEVTKNFAKKYELTLLLKGKNTIITNGEMLFVNSTGNSHMANGGMGDCLTGIICSLAGQKYDLIQSASIGAYLHGKIADELVKSQYIVNATDIIDNISKYINKIF
ncbi:bifunctional ADP-dependent NAD(P)H-hydrate dehydratase/NAD(P)H-hydrate epimerase [Leptotrichia trevisanii]|uniref:bifunctional ADP-dependent NAD(P)H-hydrate dehydratase/NAD(P)H-hydrate epimerase n=1 Tax=Leptotrichia trevisanii TaxID=109328 RepID=UPI00041271F0|nr:bifunctional ADP-dependent NAD(P)H-hydrate dehydratase/NAD(P)H-hydrate epimerase [Leptotrichia trevisanii]